MTTTQTTRELNATTDHTEGTDDRCDARTLVQQIGMRNILAISGGRVYDTGHGVILPVSNGYKVVVDLMAGDTYRVRRLFIRGTKVWLKGERTEVYCEDLGTVARMAASFESYDADEWPHQA